MLRGLDYLKRLCGFPSLVSFLKTSIFLHDYCAFYRVSKLFCSVLGVLFPVLFLVVWILLSVSLFVSFSFPSPISTSLQQCDSVFKAEATFQRVNTISQGHVKSSFQCPDRNYKANSIGQYFMVVMLVFTETHAERESERENAKKAQCSEGKAIHQSLRQRNQGYMQLRPQSSYP